MVFGSYMRINILLFIWGTPNIISKVICISEMDKIIAFIRTDFVISIVLQRIQLSLQLF